MTTVVEAAEKWGRPSFLAIKVTPELAAELDAFAAMSDAQIKVWAKARGLDWQQRGRILEMVRDWRGRG